MDDDHDMLEPVIGVLTDQGYEVASAENGQIALEYIAAHGAPALIVLDLNMPVFDGWSVLSALQRDPALSAIPVLVTTADDRRPTLRDGASVVLRKPFLADALVREIQTLTVAARKRQVEGAVDSTGHPQRDHTDESRAERNRASAVAQKAVDEEADEVVRIARQRADQVLQTARDGADRERRTQSTPSEASVHHGRTHADALLAHERSSADGVLEQERAERRRYLADFLEIEREVTNKEVIAEPARADEVIAARDEFLATVSYDLRSLLGGISLNAGLLVNLALEGAGGETMRKHAATSQRLVARMNLMVSDLLDISSIEEGKLVLLPEHVEVAKIRRDTVNAFQPIAAAKSIALDADDVAALPLHAWFDGGRILQVLANLVSNAIRFTLAEGRVSIRIRIDRNEIQFSVSDTGIGMTEDALQVVFERVRQVSKDRRGLGLGLHISKCIVEAHGGRMWAESKLGAGSTFHFAVPAGIDRRMNDD